MRFLKLLIFVGFVGWLVWSGVQKHRASVEAEEAAAAEAAAAEAVDPLEEELSKITPFADMPPERPELPTANAVFRDGQWVRGDTPEIKLPKPVDPMEHLKPEFKEGKRMSADEFRNLRDEQEQDYLRKLQGGR